MIQLWFVMAIPPRGCRVGEGEHEQLDGIGLGVPVLHGGLVVPYAPPGCEQRLAPYYQHVGVEAVGSHHGLDAGLSGAVGTEMIPTSLGLMTLLSSVGSNSANSCLMVLAPWERRTQDF
jgi:hypothetical protein